MKAERGQRRVGKTSRVVLTGGPAAGKTAVADVLRRQLADQVAVLPEAATLLFTGGFPRPQSPPGRRLVQKTIYEVQHHLEEIYLLTDPDKTHICDRGTLDGAAFWPGGLDRFLGAIGTTLESEYRRYDAVIFLQTSAHRDGAYTTANSARIETADQALKIDQKLQSVWEGHPHFFMVPHTSLFYEKVASVLITLHRALGLGVAIPEGLTELRGVSETKRPAPHRSRKKRRTSSR